MMAIIKTKKERNYVCIDNAVLENTKLSLKAKGLLAYLLTKPDSWEISVSHLITQSTDGRTAIYSAISELEELGYIKKTRLRDESGKVLSFQYIVYERPTSSSPYSGFPDMENPDMENQPLVSTDNSNTDNSNHICADDGFENFWVIWPSGYKVGKKVCAKHWKTHNLEKKAGLICADVTQRKTKDSRWHSGYVPNPITYLRQERWEDDIVTKRDVNKIDEIKRKKIESIKALTG